MEKKQSTNVLAAYTQARDQSPMLRSPGGTTMLMRATGAQTGNTLAIVEFIFPPGSGFPMHIHHREDETLYILEGTLLVVCGENRVEAKPGTFIYGPRTIPHGYRSVGNEPARFLESFLPAGLEQLFLATGEPITDQTRPQTQKAAEPYMQAMADMMAKYQIDIVGPIPE
ncbi:MAG: cupin domain-containing protein [Chloroflexi bacterium]|nr:cupin domain-containing protein [Chloroflexota bacterium]